MSRNRFRITSAWRAPGSNGDSRARRLGLRRGGIVLVSLLLAGLVAGGLAQLRVETGTESFLPAGDKTVQQQEHLASSFGGDPVVVLAESKDPARMLGPDQLPRLLNLEGELAALPDSAVVYGPGTTLNQVAGQAQNLLSEISGRRDGLRAAAESAAVRQGATPQAASAAASRAVADFDQRYGSLLVQGLPAGLPTLHNPSFANTVVYNQAGQPKPQWRFVVPSQHSVAVLVRPRQNLDQAGTERLVDGVRNSVKSAGLDADRVTVSGVPVVADDLGRQVAREAPILGCAGLVAVAACFVAMPWTRWRRRLLPLMTSVGASATTLAIFGWLGWPLSLGVVAFLPILLGIGSDFPTYLAQRARWRVVVSVAVATAAGFGALIASPLPFVRDLGLAVGIGVLLSVGLGIAVAGRLKRPDHREERRRLTGADAASAASGHPTRHRRVRTVGAVLLTASSLAGWIALPGLQLEANPQRLASGVPAVESADHVENVMGSSGEMDVVLRGEDVRSPQALAWERAAQGAIVAHYGDRMRPIVSAPDLLRFLGDSPTSEQINAGLRLLPPYLTGAVQSDDSRVSRAAFGVKMQDLQNLRELRDGAQRVMPPPPPGYQVEVTGLPVVAVRGYELLSNGRYLSNLLGIGATALVLVTSLRRRADAVRAIAAALLATGAGMFLLWLTATPLTPLTVGLGSLTAAVGCEFTVLLAESSRTNDPALRRSVLVAASAAASGYVVLAFSSVSVIHQFGVLLPCSVGLSLASAFVVTQLFGQSGPNHEKSAGYTAAEGSQKEGVKP